MGGLTFMLFFDFENFLFRGREPEEKINEVKAWYARDHVPKAKEISGTEIESNSSIIEDLETDSSQLDEKDDSSKTKSKKSSFRDRKVFEKNYINI